MLADPRGEAMSTRFASQWLRLQDLEKVIPDPILYPYSDQTLSLALKKETELFFDSLVREDRSLLDLLTVDYTCANERVVRHYGIPNIRGDYFRKIPLAADSPRRGLLGQGSILTVTSIATRTSPVQRGKWVLQNILGTPPPVPPQNVETNLEADPKAAKPNSLRERLESIARSRSALRATKSWIDRILLENFDMIGNGDHRWRSSINSSGVLVDGTP
jgi:hypothetical protein